MHSLADRYVTGQPLTAAERALMRWHPDTPLYQLQNLCAKQPGYLLLQGGAGGAA